MDWLSYVADAVNDDEISGHDFDCDYPLGSSTSSRGHCIFDRVSARQFWRAFLFRLSKLELHLRQTSIVADSRFQLIGGATEEASLANLLRAPKNKEKNSDVSRENQRAEKLCRLMSVLYTRVSQISAQGKRQYKGNCCLGIRY